MLFTCVTACGPKFTDVVPSNTDPSNKLIVAVTDTPLGLYTPTFVRDSPLTRLVNTETTDAALDGNPGTNIPTCPPPAAGDLNCDVTTRSPAAWSLVNSTAPKLDGDENKLTQISSNPRASRGASANACDAPLNRYTAVTFITFVYDVLNTLTSDTNGTPPCPVADAATGNVTVSANRARGSAARQTVQAERRNRSRNGKAPPPRKEGTLFRRFESGVC